MDFEKLDQLGNSLVGKKDKQFFIIDVLWFQTIHDNIPFNTKFKHDSVTITYNKTFIVTMDEYDIREMARSFLMYKIGKYADITVFLQTL